MDRIRAPIIISTGTLPKTGGTYSLVLLSRNHINAMLELEEAVHGNLQEDQRADIVPHDRAAFERHFDEGHIAVGLMHQGRIAAQSLLLLPSAQYPDTHIKDMRFGVKPEKVAVLSGMRVLPEYRGNNIQNLMIEARLGLALQNSRPHVITECAARNKASWHNLLQDGLAIHSMGRDPDDGTALYNLHARVKPLMKRRLKPDFNKAACRKNTVHILRADLAQQEKLLAAGHKGVCYHRDSDTIGFKKAPKSKFCRAG